MFGIPAKWSNWVLVFGQLLAQLSDRMLSLGLIWFITENFGESFVTWYLVFGGLPHLLVSWWSGQAIQKIGALSIVVSADWIRAIVFASAAIVFKNISSHGEFYSLVAVIFVSNFFGAFFNPAILSLPLEIESGDGVQKLTARLSSVSSLAIVLGPLLGMVIFKHLGLNGLFLLASISYLISGFCGWSLRDRVQEKLRSTLLAPFDGEVPHVDGKVAPVSKETDSMVDSVSVSMLDTLFSDGLVVSMLCVFLFMNLFISPLQVQIPFLAKNVFEGNFNAMAAMEMGLGLGIVTGGLVLSLFTIQKHILRYCYLFLGAMGICFLSFQYSKNLYAAVFFLTAMGFFVGLANILIVNLFQTRPQANHVPNVMSLVNLIGTAVVPMSLLVFGILQSNIAVPVIGLWCGYGLLVVCVSSLLPFRIWGRDLF